MNSESGSISKKINAKPRTSDARPPPTDALQFLPYACLQLQTSYCLRMLPETQDEYVSLSENKDRARGKSMKALRIATSVSQELRQDSLEAGAAPPLDDDEIPLGAVLDPAGRLLELRLTRARLPRQLVQVVALCAPFQPLLARFSAHCCALERRALAEVARLAGLAHLTDVSLDGSPAPEGGYCALFEGERLRRVSLAGCALGDAEVAAIAARLAHPAPASRALRALSLVSNAVTDAGARALGAALRGNRTLQYLNLAGNRIADEGAARLLASLAEFPLEYDELVASRRARLEHARRRRSAVARFAAQLAAAQGAPGRAAAAGAAAAAAEEARGKRRSARPARASNAALAHRAEALAAEAVAAWSDPFRPEETVVRGDTVHSRGNAALLALNLAYNNLTYESVRGVARVLRAQAARGGGGGAGGGGGGGLLRVVLEGNALPRDCAEYREIDALLEAAVLTRSAAAKPEKAQRTKRK